MDNFIQRFHGRTIEVTPLDDFVTPKLIEDFFSQYGAIEKVKFEDDCAVVTFQNRYDDKTNNNYLITINQLISDFISFLF